jgi:hypothetical protein
MVHKTGHQGRVIEAFDRPSLPLQSSLRHLYFCNNGISPEAAGAIHELLVAPKELRTLHFYNNMSGTLVSLRVSL